MSMAGSLTHDVIKGPPAPPIDRGWGGDGGNDGRGADRRASFTGLFVLLAASTMVFAALTSAFVVRRGLSDDWASMPKPQILWLNTAVLLASSVVLDLSRRALKAGNRSRFNLWWTAGTALGILFLVGQAIAWSQLKSAGVFIASNPSSSFFYVLTASHAFHLLGGVLALAYVDVQALRLRLGPAKRTAIDVTAIFWHFLDGLWVYLMILFYVWG
ncbi:Cytochrome c oxidase, subunit III [Candidatus Sulfopaludibacter sp. SbA3]|nr:Cytochrome c oxidase, subunit III [Candidatus Sulfopaludibacter sp. SbA3]